MRKLIYQAICNRIIAANLGIGFISLWNNNIEALTKQKTFRLPAVFVEFEPIVWSQLSQRVRTADIGICLHIVTDSLATPEAGGVYQDQALAHLDLIERVSAAITGMPGAGFNALMLTESITDHNHETIQHHEERYTTHVSNNSAAKPIAITIPK